MNDSDVLAANFIGGKWGAGRGEIHAIVRNPATEDTLARLPHATPDDVRRALSAAKGSFALWRDTDVNSRSDILRRAAAILNERIDSAAHVLTLEQGKTLAESRAELLRAIETFRWHADAGPRVMAPRPVAGGAVTVHPEPLGVVGAFTPWNYPAVIVARKLSASLIAGCPVVLKAAEEVPSVAVHIVRALEEAGLPTGVVNLVFGDPSAISAQILAEPDVRAMSFTGSTAVGKQLAARAAPYLTRCVLELGGHAPVIVFGDADLGSSVRAITAYKFECAGQSCNAPSRIYVHESRYREFVDALAGAATALRLGDGREESTDMGPLANGRRQAAMDRLIRDASGHGSRIITGGTRGRDTGYFWQPTVLTNVADDAALSSEEVFGPVMPVWPFSTYHEAIKRSNASAYGLAAYVFTQSDTIAGTAVRDLAAGSVGVNGLQGVPPDVGIAGIKDSGYGYEGGDAGIEAFLNLKVIRRTGTT